MDLSLQLTLFLLFCGSYLLFQPHRKRTEHALPPGPTPLPLLGNLLQIQGKEPWKRFAEWGEQYGPIITFKAGLRTVIVLNTGRAVRDVLEKRAKINSSRPKLVAVDRAVKSSLFAVLPDGPLQSAVHRVQSKVFNPQTAKGIRGIQLITARCALFNMLENNTSDIRCHFDHFVISGSSSMMFGAKIGSVSQDQIDADQALVSQAIDTFATRNVLGDLFPFLTRIPGWAQKGGNEGDLWLEAVRRHFDGKIEHALRSPAWNITKVIHQQRPDEMTEEGVRMLTAELNITSTATMPLMMKNIAALTVLYPHEFRRVQSEIDQAVGGRLPTFDDSDRLPWTHAFLKECMRFAPLVPLGVPHAPTEDNVYMGCRIPADSIIVPNQWAINRCDDFDDPTSFNPQRWIDDPSLPGPALFGYGTRACPGRAIATNGLFILLAYMAWGFNLDGVVDATPEKAVPLIITFDTSGIRYSCRSSDRREIIQQEWLKSDTDPSALLNSIGDNLRV